MGIKLKEQVKLKGLHNPETGEQYRIRNKAYYDKLANKKEKKKKKERPDLRKAAVSTNKPVQKKIADKSFYTSKEWLELRYKALVFHKAICQCCGASRKTGAVIHVDHIKPRSKYPFAIRIK